MAYRNFAEWPLAQESGQSPALLAPAAAAHADVAREEGEPARLGALEWSVVALAQRDRLSSLQAPGRIAAAMGLMFGTRRGNPRLADPRLEALRRLAVLAWHRGYALPVSELKAFLAAGYTVDQYDLIQTSISRGRASLARRARG